MFHQQLPEKEQWTVPLLIQDLRHNMMQNTKVFPEVNKNLWSKSCFHPLCFFLFFLLPQSTAIMITKTWIGTKLLLCLLLHQQENKELDLPFASNYTEIKWTYSVLIFSQIKKKKVNRETSVVYQFIYVVEWSDQKTIKWVSCPLISGL